MASQALKTTAAWRPQFFLEWDCFGNGLFLCATCSLFHCLTLRGQAVSQLRCRGFPDGLVRPVHGVTG